ncbi:neuropeptide FF receptor 2 [Patella vulgata]|uniref:neuropeptide FF receptor 2 n=1 Tax=Patella vulgata TaxID=6465 RepID=UPI0021806317|nr:neuropeptide FF receptor 2 [Patella vulgata]
MDKMGDKSNIYWINSSNGKNATGQPAINISDGLWSEDGDYMDYAAIDYSQRNYPEELRTIPIWEMVLKIGFYVPVIVLALLGNLLVILVVARNKRMKTTTNYYIVNLAISDLLVALSCSWVHLLDNLTDGWILGAFFCKFNTFAQVLSLVSSIFTLTFIACDRFFGIVFAMKAHFIERRARYTIIAMWACSLVVATPLLVYRDLYVVHWKNYIERWCDDQWPVSHYVDPLTNMTLHTIPARKIYYTVVCVVLFFLPCVVMSVAYAVIIWTLWASQAPGERMTKDIKVQSKLKKKVIVMLVLILALFVICWLPLIITLLYSEYRPDKHSRLEEWYVGFEYFARYLAHANSAINPLIYAGFNDNFRKGFQNLFTWMDRKKRYNTMVYRVDSFQSSTNITKV